MGTKCISRTVKCAGCGKERRFIVPPAAYGVMVVAGIRLENICEACKTAGKKRVPPIRNVQVRREEGGENG